MSTAPMPRRVVGNGYPTTDHKPMAETDLHRDLMIDLILTLKAFYAAEPLVYVSGNLLLCYEENNRRRHVSPDVFVVRGVAKHRRENYLLWEEGHSPRFAIELTSSSTREEDTDTKFELYRDVIRVREYFLFDPMGDYLTPSMQGWRLVKGVYRPIRPVADRLPSQTTGLHLERDGNELRLWNPATEAWLPTPTEWSEEAKQARDEAKQARKESEQARKEADERADKADDRAARAEAEVRRLRAQFGLPDEEV